MRPLSHTAGITATVIGVVMNLALWFALHVIFRGRAFDVLGMAGDGQVRPTSDVRKVRSLVGQWRHLPKKNPATAADA